MTDDLPQLPPTSWVDVPHFTYTAQQMRAYAAAAVAQAIEACAELCADLISLRPHPDDYQQGWDDGAEACEQAIRATLPRTKEQASRE